VSYRDGCAASVWASHYKLLRSCCGGHFCTSEVAALCLNLAGDHVAGQALEAYLDVFTHHCLQAKNQLPIVWDGAVHQRFYEGVEHEAVDRQGAVPRSDAPLEATPTA